MRDKVILLSSDQLGNGEADLGRTILETFFTLLKQQPELPHAIVCMNRGVFALTDQSLSSVHLGELERAGVRVIACKTCVDHYDVESRLQAGVVGSMLDFVELAAAHPVITIA